MQLANLRQRPEVHWEHTHDQLCEDVDYNNPAQVVEHHRPFLSVNLNEVAQINELTYKELAGGIDGAFLDQKVRADMLAPVDYIGFADSLTARDARRYTSPVRNIMIFHVKSSEYADNGIIYPNAVMFEDWDDVANDSATPSYRDKALFLIWASNVRLNCSCPSYTWWGYQYILTQLDAAIFPTNVFPKVRNPQVRGVVCKHLNRVLRHLPFYTAEIAREMQKQFGGVTT